MNPVAYVIRFPFMRYYRAEAGKMNDRIRAMNKKILIFIPEV